MPREATGLARARRPPRPRSGGGRRAPALPARLRPHPSHEGLRGVHASLEDTADLLDLEANGVPVHGDRRDAQIGPLFGNAEPTDIVPRRQPRDCNSDRTGDADPSFITPCQAPVSSVNVASAGAGAGAALAGAATAGLIGCTGARPAGGDEGAAHAAVKEQSPTRTSMRTNRA